MRPISLTRFGCFAVNLFRASTALVATGDQVVRGGTMRGLFSFTIVVAVMSVASHPAHAISKVSVTPVAMAAAAFATVNAQGTAPTTPGIRSKAVVIRPDRDPWTPNACTRVATRMVC